ncbi:hypothetical protein WR25_06477 isoform A [Diploscapter pachys]|uniref:N-acetylgalactosaminide beta-1,3-galactosyltransferase n=1 Tax=Diploscapter pachys TaxID=2018661 RepID=A0A2A2LFG3_9BILA|nr:hypothetical protein WR25_06477 isoform A [Diploscapter pachys]
MSSGSMKRHNKAEDGDPSWTQTLQKAFRSGGDWQDKDELLDVVYWGKQILAVLIGVVFGLTPLYGILAIATYVAISTLVTQHYVTKFQGIDEEELGGFWELAKEGFGSAFASFMVSWITVFSAVYHTSSTLEKSANWYIFVEESSKVNFKILHDFLATKDSSNDLFYGHGLRDQSLTIIHHFYGYNSEDNAPFEYPDFGCGMVLSKSLVEKLVQKLATSKFKQFSIDAKHEFGLYIFENIGVRLTSMPELFCYEKSEKCAVWLSVEESCGAPVHTDKIYVGIKTWSGYHISRLPVVKRTWGGKFLNIEYVSDKTDQTIPTISFGVNNTERGHCAKTFAILERFLNLQNEIKSQFQWLLIADDDTLVSVERLVDLLSCYDSAEKVIIGERYGFGFSDDGKYGYSYPTGGSGMIFAPSAVSALVANCLCPSPDSPDDMIIGLCASVEKIPIVHVAGMHQARPIDYSPEYIKRQKSISFHKFDEIDPYKTFGTYLREEKPDKNTKSKDEL